MEELKNENVKPLDELEDETAEENNTAEENTQKKNSFLKELLEWTQTIAFAVVLALLINQFLFSVVQVEGHSMDPTLGDKQRLIVTKLFYEPKAGDIVIVKSSALQKNIVKRVIATEGQEIIIEPSIGAVIVDGEVLDEPYIMENLRSSGNKYVYPLTVPENTVFVMGDNRNNSQDSRSIGVIPKEEIVGKAVFRIMPFDKFGGLYGNLD